MTSVEIHGVCDAHFAPLKDAFAANFTDGYEVGASLAFSVEGRPVVDLWAGHADPWRKRPWERDTLVVLFSGTKLALILSFLRLVDRGLVDLDATVASYWPAFAAGGKDRVTVRHAMTHCAGVPGFDPPVAFETLHDWEAATANIAAQQHWFGGEPTLCYHPSTYGFILGEVLRRVDGRLPSQVFREEIAEPAGIDLLMGARDPADQARIARLGLLGDPKPHGGTELGQRVLASSGTGDWATPARYAAEIPASNGYGNARSLARLAAIPAQGGELDGVRYLPRALVDELCREQVYAKDPVFDWIRLGLGLSLHSEAFPAPVPSCVHWGGAGGVLLGFDRPTGASFGYAMNNLDFSDVGQSHRRNRLWAAFGAAIEVAAREARMTEIHGFCDDRFRPLKDAFAANFADGYEVGASLAFSLGGRPVADLWAGHMDAERTRPWEKDTLVWVSSTAKLPLVFCMMRLVDRGLIELDTPVATYWPEFAAGGKERVSVRHALIHCGGVPGFNPQVPFETLLDWDAATANLAAQPHWFAGAPALCYHPVTYGYLLGEILWRVDGRMASQFFREEIAGPAGIDLPMRLTNKADMDRIAAMGFYGGGGPAHAVHPLRERALASAAQGDVAAWPYRSCESPSGNSYANARGIARLGSIAALDGELEGRRYLSKAIVNELWREQVYADEPFFGMMRLGLGLSRHSEGFPAPIDSCIHWGGGGGSLALMDRQTGASFGYAMNNFYIGGAGPEFPRRDRLWAALGEVFAGL